MSRNRRKRLKNILILVGIIILCVYSFKKIADIGINWIQKGNVKVDYEHEWDNMSDEDKTKADKEALQKAKDIIKKLKNGESFDDLAKEYSDDTSNKDKGGDLGYFNTGDMLEEFEKAAFALKKGKYTTTPVKTKYGYHIILKTDEKEKPSLEDKKEEIIKTLADDAKSNDTALSINALVELRKEYGMNIEDDEMSKLYSTYISNSLLSAKSNSSK